MTAYVLPHSIPQEDERLTPDFHPVPATDSPVMRDFWQSFPAWAANHGIDHFIGRRVGVLLSNLGIQEVEAHGETILFNGGSLPARSPKLTMEEIGQSIRASGPVGQTVWSETMAWFDNPRFWTWQNSYVTMCGRKSAA